MRSLFTFGCSILLASCLVLKAEETPVKDPAAKETPKETAPAPTPAPEVKPAEVKPADTKPAETKAETKVAENKPPEPKEPPLPKDPAEVEFDDATEDEGFVCPVKPNLDHLEAGSDQQKRFIEWAEKFNAWPEKPIENKKEKVRAYLNVASLIDIAHGEFEGESAYVVFERIKKEVPKDELIKIAFEIMLKPSEGKVMLKLEEVGVDTAVDEVDLRDRISFLSKKLLGRLLGKLPPK